MKIKQHVVITDINDFLRGDYDTCFTLFATETHCGNWVNCGAIEFEINVDRASMARDAIKAIDEQLDKELDDYTARVAILERRKKELLALPAPQNSVD